MRDHVPAARLTGTRLAHDPLNVLICEPDARALHELLARIDGRAADVRVAPDGAQVLFDVGVREPDLLLLSVQMPGVALARVVEIIRPVSDLTIIALDGGGLASDRALAQVDGVLRKPFAGSAVDQVLASVRQKLDGAGAVLRAGAMILDPLGYDVRLRGQRIAMPTKELEVLAYLMRHPDQIVSVEELQAAVWPTAELVAKSKTPAVTVAHLRSRFPGGEGARIVRTMYRKGYRFCPPGDEPGTDA